MNTTFDYQQNILTDTVAIIGYNGPGGLVIVPDTIDGRPVGSIEIQAFAGNNRITSVILHDSVIRIRSCAFQSCTALQSITLGSRTTDIDDRAFYGCSALSYIFVGDALFYIGYEAFYDCLALKTIRLPTTMKSMLGAFPASTNVFFEDRKGV